MWMSPLFLTSPPTRFVPRSERSPRRRSGAIGPRTGTPLRVPQKGNLYYSYTDQATEDWLLRFAPNELKNVRFVIALPKPGLQQGEPHGRARASITQHSEVMDRKKVGVPIKSAPLEHGTPTTIAHTGFIPGANWH
jgi:hypothetical protein